jgi:hypothetical protein
MHPYPKVNWQNALANCQQQGAELFVASSTDDLLLLNKAVAEAMHVSGNKDLSELWLGASRAPGDGT